ncbi:MAG: gliding motility protein GldM [Chitinophagia bacterium]|nr:gliding motility protein GldM [Chitinophagia bacterium]
MAGANETPRQKMMGILYLVLLGLAATTITDKVLDAFRSLTLGLEASSKDVQSTIDEAFATFSATKLKDDRERALPYWERANRIKKSCDALQTVLNDCKTKLINECHGFDSVKGDYKSREDVDISARIFFGTKQGRGQAKILRKAIEDTKAAILAELDEKERANFKMALNADDPKPKKGEIKRTWQENFFGEGTPLTAAFTALAKVEADLRSTEAAAVKNILGNVDKAKINFDDYVAVAIPTSSTFIYLGQQYQAEVFITGRNNTLKPEIVVGGQTLAITDGKGTYSASGTREGEFKWKAHVKMKMADGKDWEGETEEMTYRVSKPVATVSADKMNVFYIGVDNPVSVSAPGTAKENLSVSISQGKISGGNGAYNVTVDQPGKVNVNVSGKGSDGKTTMLGTMEFRCKRLPDPIAKFGGKSFGTVPKAQLVSQNRIFALMPEGFDFDVKFNITHFKLYVNKPHSDVQSFENTSNALTAPMTAALNGVVSGTRVFFGDIIAVGPDGSKRSLQDIVFTVQ